MNTPPLKPLIIASPTRLRQRIHRRHLVWRFNTPNLPCPSYSALLPAVWSIWTTASQADLINIVITVALFTSPHCLPKAPSAQAFLHLGHDPDDFRLHHPRHRRPSNTVTIAFGCARPSHLTTLTYTPRKLLADQSISDSAGPVLYSVNTLIFQIIPAPPPRPGNRRQRLRRTLATTSMPKPTFSTPTKPAWLGNRQIDLAMSNTGVITAFNQCRAALFYRLRGQHRHPRTAKMLRYYLSAQEHA